LRLAARQGAACAGERHGGAQRAPPSAVRVTWVGSAAELPEDLIEQRDDRGEDPADTPSTGRGRIEKSRNRAEKVAEQVPRPLLCRDVEDNLIELDAKAEQVEVQRAEREIEDIAGTRGLERRGDGLRDGPQDRARRVGQRARQRAHRDQATAGLRNAIDRVVAGERSRTAQGVGEASGHGNRDGR